MNIRQDNFCEGGFIGENSMVKSAQLGKYCLIRKILPNWENIAHEPVLFCDDFI